ncbi:MAG TPA: L-rhamnose mutarotase [Flavitalea sp.]|nr:L-rhamnose mutarotase [Flavitalea sp.]
MNKVAFKMHLHKGKAQEYRKRHDEIPAELKTLLASVGISDYYIFLDESRGDLFAIMNIEDEQKLESLSGHPVMKKWWTMMKDIMDTNEDDSPVTVPLINVFYMK